MEEGLKEGPKKGEHLMLELLNAMLADNREGELPKLYKEPAFLEAMMGYYRIGESGDDICEQ